MLNELSLTLVTHAQSALIASQDRASEETGATTVEYIMILGIMAVVVALIFLGIGGDNLGLKGAIDGLGERIKTFIGNIDPNS